MNNFARCCNKSRQVFFFFALWLIFVRLWLKPLVFTTNCNIFANKPFTGIRWPMTPVISWVVPCGRTDVAKLKLLFATRRMSLIKMHVTLYWVRPRDRTAVSYHIYRSWWPHLQQKSSANCELCWLISSPHEHKQNVHTPYNSRRFNRLYDLCDILWPEK